MSVFLHPPGWPPRVVFLSKYYHLCRFSCPLIAIHVCFPTHIGFPVSTQPVLSQHGKPCMFSCFHRATHGFSPVPSHPPKAVFMSLTGHPCLFPCPHTATLFVFLSSTATFVSFSVPTHACFSFCRQLAYLDSWRQCK